jgi:hypothetical protein
MNTDFENKKSVCLGLDCGMIGDSDVGGGAVVSQEFGKWQQVAFKGDWK